MSGPPSGRRRASPAGDVGRAGRTASTLGAAERRRLQNACARSRRALPLDVAIELGVAGRALAADAVSLEDMQATVDANLDDCAADIPRRVGHDDADTTPPGL